MADAGLHAVRHSGAEADVRPCASGHRGTRPRLSAASCDPCHADRLRRRARQIAAPNDIRWRDETKTAHADYLAFTEKPTDVPGRGQSRRDHGRLRDKLPADAMVCNGAGNFSIWLHRFYRYRRYGTLLRADLRLDGLRPAGGGRDEAADPERTVRRVLRRRRFPDDRAGIRDRRAVRPADHRRSSSTTACTAPSACIRSATIPAASSRRR